ncbi:MAG: transposase [Acidobacteriota bacterium]
MSKRTYRAKSVKTLDLDRLGKELEAAQRLVFSLDIAKDVMFATLKVEAELVHTTLKWHHLESTSEVVSWLSGFGPRVEVAMEPSGTYGDTLRWHLERSGVAVYQVSPKKVKDSREIYDGVPSSHDAKAAAIIGWLHWQGRSELWPERSDVDRHMKAAVETLRLYQVPFQRCLNRLEGSLARYWPELGGILSLSSVTLLELLQEFGGPSGVAATPQRAGALMRRVGGNGLASTSIDRVLSSSQETLGVAMLASECEALQALAGEARRLQQCVRRAREQVEALSQGDAELQHLAPVVGKVTAVVLMLHNGRLSAYRNARSFEKALGLNLKIRQSGKYSGQLKLTKRGPGVGRQYLYLASLRLIKDDPLARAWYEAKLQRDPGGSKKKALVAVMRKLARALWWVAQGAPFTTEKLFDARRLKMA